MKADKVLAHNPLSEFHRDLPIGEPPVNTGVLFQRSIIQPIHASECQSRIYEPKSNRTPSAPPLKSASPRAAAILLVSVSSQTRPILPTTLANVQTPATVGNPTPAPDTSFAPSDSTSTATSGIDATSADGSRLRSGGVSPSRNHRLAFYRPTQFKNKQPIFRLESTKPKNSGSASCYKRIAIQAPVRGGHLF